MCIPKIWLLEVQLYLFTNAISMDKAVHHIVSGTKVLAMPTQSF